MFSDTMSCDSLQERRAIRIQMPDGQRSPSYAPTSRHGRALTPSSTGCPQSRAAPARALRAKVIQGREPGTFGRDCCICLIACLPAHRRARAGAIPHLPSRYLGRRLSSTSSGSAVEVQGGINALGRAMGRRQDARRTQCPTFPVYPVTVTFDVRRIALGYCSAPGPHSTEHGRSPARSDSSSTVVPRLHPQTFASYSRLSSYILSSSATPRTLHDGRPGILVSFADKTGDLEQRHVAQCLKDAPARHMGGYGCIVGVGDRPQKNTDVALASLPARRRYRGSCRRRSTNIDVTVTVDVAAAGDVGVFARKVTPATKNANRRGARYAS
ncbi:hypothetical protein EXIGLDRAFT_193533 [Exidia glandulosa HHB12029]|uniref:Uncharacterized protein n=1 Tax=Exidia glandulosa HHB12029 TaxID=1314781 RepID=A0A165EWS1_EXIGL|nr:hypothetical protein EXIGLDRAFT_193533 [Exidia glandulosa HHB12029]